MFGNGVFLATHFMDHIQSLSKFFKATADLSIIIFLFSVKASKTFSWGQRPSYHQMWRMFDEYVFSYDSANSIDNYRDQSNRDWPFVSPIIHLADKPAYSYLKYVYVFDGSGGWNSIKLQFSDIALHSKEAKITRACYEGICRACTKSATKQN